MPRPRNVLFRTRCASAVALAAAGGAALACRFLLTERHHSQRRETAPVECATEEKNNRTAASCARRRRRPQKNTFPPRVLYSAQSEHQDISVVEYGKGPRSDIRLFIDGELQFSSVDEYRYHEGLVHPAVTLARSLVTASGNSNSRGGQSKESGLCVLLLGAGDGLAAREVLKHGDAIASVDVVDMDSDITDLFRNDTPHTVPRLVQLCEGAFEDEKVILHTTDAKSFLLRHETISKYDVVIMDLPDPVTEELAQLYTVEFFSSALSALRQDTGGVLVTHGGDIFAKRSSFWSIVETLRVATMATEGRNLSLAVDDRSIAAYSALVPSFGLWGFTIACIGTLYDKATPAATKACVQREDGNQVGTLAEFMQRMQLPFVSRFLSQQTLGALFELPPDVVTPSAAVQINTHAHPILHTLVQSDNIWAP